MSVFLATALVPLCWLLPLSVSATRTADLSNRIRDGG